MRQQGRVHKMELPHKVIVGEELVDKLEEISEEISESKRVVVITGPNVYQKLKNKLPTRWREKGGVSVIFAGEATWDEARRIASIIQSRADLIVAFGGGRVIDIAKVVAITINTEFVSVPTSASHDGIASPLASLKGRNRPYSVKAKPPISVIVDVDVIRSAPRRLIASGFGDAVAKLTAVRDWKLAHLKTGEYYGEYAAKLALMGAELVIKNAEGIGAGDVECIRTLIEALISDGVAAGIAGSSRPCSGSEHLFSHALDVYSDWHALHGEQCGVGTVIMGYLHGLDHDEIRDALQAAGAPVNARDLRIPPGNLVKALVLARTIRPERYTILDEVRLDEKQALDVLRKTKVI